MRENITKAKRYFHVLLRLINVMCKIRILYFKATFSLKFCLRLVFLRVGLFYSPLWLVSKIQPGSSVARVACLKPNVACFRRRWLVKIDRGLLACFVASFFPDGLFCGLF